MYTTDSGPAIDSGRTKDDDAGAREAAFRALRELLRHDTKPAPPVAENGKTTRDHLRRIKDAADTLDRDYGTKFALEVREYCWRLDEICRTQCDISTYYNCTLERWPEDATFYLYRCGERVSMVDLLGILEEMRLSAAPQPAQG
jgi:hypothetical protein